MAWRTIAFLLAGCFATPVISQVIQQQAVQAGSAQSPALDAARNAAGNPDDSARPGAVQRDRKPGGLFTIQGDGIGLPSGVGDRGPAQTDEKKRKVDEAANAGCTGVNRDGQACRSDGAGTNPVAERIERGAERDPGVARPTDTSVKGAGIGVPICFGDSRDSASCK